MRGAFLFLPFLLLLTKLAPVSAQPTHWVAFTDKDQTPYSIDQPGAFLSEEAIERREEHGIPIDEKDLPVDPAYRDSILSHPSVELVHSSKWFNAISIISDDSLHMDTIDQWSFVRARERVKALKLSPGTSPKLEDHHLHKALKNGQWHSKNLEFGESKRQLAMMGLDHLLNLGHRGEGIRIALMDAGFPGVDQMEAFSHIFEEGRYIGGFDAVEGHHDPFHAHGHGRTVLSTLAAVKEEEYMGAAPEASYILCRTEDAGSEYRIEEHNWIAAAEFADSAGADILSSSLSYTTFDDSSMDYTLSDMDGNSTLITRGADLAASRGMLVVSSAGNYGNSSWGIVGAPADGDSVLAIGAVDEEGKTSDFSSRGPTADGRIKPDLVALGEGTAIMGGDGSILRGNGTSFSAPLISGGAASLWSAHPELSPMELHQKLLQSADRHQNPDNEYGHGIPDLYGLFLEEEGLERVEQGEGKLIAYGPNPLASQLQLQIYSGDSEEIRLTWWDIKGRKLRESVHPIAREEHRIVELSRNELPSAAAIYVLEIDWMNGEKEQLRIVKEERP